MGWIEIWKKFNCILISDEMAFMHLQEPNALDDIRINWDNVDSPEVKEMLTFMVIVLNGHWKIAIHYF